MFNLEIGQVLEFIEPARVDDEQIPKGTRVRIGFIEPSLPEPMVTVLILGTDDPRSWRMPRHVLTLHCRTVSTAG